MKNARSRVTGLDQYISSYIITLNLFGDPTCAWINGKEMAGLHHKKWGCRSYEVNCFPLVVYSYELQADDKRSKFQDVNN